MGQGRSFCYRRNYSYYSEFDGNYFYDCGGGLDEFDDFLYRYCDFDGNRQYYERGGLCEFDESVVA